MIGRLCAAAAASVALHGAALIWFAGMPNGPRPGPVFGTVPEGSMLRLSVREQEHASLEGPAIPFPRDASPRPAAQRRAAPAPIYYPVSDLDERPLVRVHVEPQFPAAAPVPEGWVQVELYIGEDGAVDKVRVTDAQPRGVFEAPAIAAFGAARFTPGRKGGMPVRSRLAIEVLFGAPAPLTQHAAAFSAPR